MSMKALLAALPLVLACSLAAGQSTSSVQYLANEGVLVTHEDTKILIDPLFQNSYDLYQLVPETLRAAMFAGEAPFVDVDAVFVSHHHGDHFSAEDMLRLLSTQTSAKLYAPTQAVNAMREISAAEDEAIFDRVVGLDLEYGNEPIRIETDSLLIEAVHIPHSGWPTARTDIQNLAFRITLDNSSTVLHMGDADPRVIHFAADEVYWEQRTVDLALPPYWFFGSEDGVEILDDRLGVKHAIGVHVPASFADEIPAEYQGRELFTLPGEGRRFKGSQ